MIQRDNGRGARIFGRPIHPMLVPFPVAFLLSVFLSDLSFVVTQSSFWATASLRLLGAALFMATLAAAAGMTDFLSQQRIRNINSAWHHMLGNVGASTLSLLNLYMRMGGKSGLAIFPWGLALSGIVAGMVLFSGWLGNELVYRYRCGMVSDQRFGGQDGESFSDTGAATSSRLKNPKSIHQE